MSLIKILMIKYVLTRVRNEVNTPLSRGAILDCVMHQIVAGRARVVLNYGVLSEDYKQAWPTIIAVLISNDKGIKVMRTYPSSTFLRKIY